jgi:2-amino-4-hydroxy-6-hydroxymethyldihydropteridine diphosphokinase
MVEITLSLGSNLGDKLQYLSSAVSTMLRDKIVTNVKLSPIYETKPILLANSPKSWDVKALHIVLKGNTDLLPAQLVKAIKEVEKKLGKKDRGRWAPREIDIDVISVGEEIYLLEDVQIPHKFMLTKEWVFLPFIDVNPNWRYPVRGDYFNMTIKEIKEHLEFRRQATVKTDLKLPIIESV